MSHPLEKEKEEEEEEEVLLPFHVKVYRKFFGGPNSLPDSTRLWLLIGMAIVHQDMSTNVLYSALIETNYKQYNDKGTPCPKLWVLWALYNSVWNAVSFPSQLGSGWIGDWIGNRAHYSLIFLAAVLALSQIATLFTTHVTALGVLYVARGLLVTQFGVQKYKIIKQRVEAH